MSQPNPLAKHFRQPVLYVRLPTQGRYWAEDSLELPASGEVPIYPMTAKDEIIIRTPDALLNGEGVVQVIQNCCPAVKNAWKIPVPDLDALLVAIRIASYGPEMSIDSRCPKCNHDNRHDVELHPILQSYRCPDYTKLLEIDGLKIRLKPVNYYEQNTRNMIRFEQDRIMQVIQDETLEDDARVFRFKQHLNKIVDINLETVTATTDYIEIEDGTRVNARDHIMEFYQNCDNNIFKKLLAHVENLASQNELPKLTLQCESCEETYTSNLEFDYASFFVVSS